MRALAISIGRGQHRHPGRLHLFDWAGIEGQHEIQIVNHEIEHHIHVRPPFAETAETMAFDEHRSPDMRTHHLHHRIEPFTVSNLKSTAALLGKLHQLLRLSGVTAIGFSTRTCLPACKQAFATA